MDSSSRHNLLRQRKKKGQRGSMPLAAYRHANSSARATRPSSSRSSHSGSVSYSQSFFHPQTRRHRPRSSSRAAPPSIDTWFEPPPPLPPPRVVLGRGTIAQLPTELGRLGLSSPLIVASPSRISLARHLQSLLPNFKSNVVESDDQLSPEVISGRDVVISLGGASAISMACSAGAKQGIPHICIPTTHSRSDDPYTPSGTENPHGFLGCEFSNGDPLADGGASRPVVIIYDENLTMSQTTRFTAPTAVSAMARSAKANTCRRVKNSTAPWSFINLPGV